MKCQLRTRTTSAARTVVEMWGTLTWLASAELTGSQITVGRVTIKSGHANPRHCHENCEEVLYLLAGKLRHSFGNETVDLVAGDTLIVPPGVMHHAVNPGPGEADMIVAYSSGQRQFRKEK